MTCPACKAPLAADARFCGNCGRAIDTRTATDFSSLYTVDSNVASPSAAQPGPLAPGAVVADRYELRTQLPGTGAVDTFLAHDRLTSLDIHLKVLRADPRFGASARQQFVRLAANARDIRHDSIAAVYDVGESDGIAWFATEAVAGVTLRDWNRQRLNAQTQLGFSSACAIIFAILDAIMTIHVRKLVRVDLKPANIALLSDPAQSQVRLKLLDVGVPHSETADTASTGFGASPYRAPEALTATTSDLQPSADVYSIAMIFYELLAGVPLAGHWHPPSAGRADVPSLVDDLIQNALSNNPRRRSQSIQEFKDALQAAIGSQGTDPKPAPPRPRPGPNPAPTPDPKPEPGPAVIVDTWKVPDFLVPILKTINMPFVLILMIVQNFANWIELLIFSGRGYTLGQKRAARGWTMLAASLVLVAAVGLAVWGGLAWYNNRETTIAQLDGAPPDAPPPDTPPQDPQVPEPEDVDPPPEPSMPPVAPVRANPFAPFNGYWADDFGGLWNVRVNDNGEARGVATAGMFAGTELVGAFSGRQFDFVVGNAYGAGAGAGMFDGGCHIDYQTLDPFGSGQLVNVKLHINHQAGAPCP